MRRARVLAGVATVIVSVGAWAWAAPASAGGGGHTSVVLASGHGFAEPTLLDTARSGSVVGMLNHNGATRLLAEGESPIEAGRARVDLWLFEQYLNVCPLATFTYRQECARETISYYPAIGDEQAALFVRGGVTFEAGALLQAMLGDLGLPTRIELPANIEAAASGLEVRERESMYAGAVRVGGALAVVLGAALVGGAVVSVVAAREPQVRAPQARASMRVA